MRMQSTILTTAFCLFGATLSVAFAQTPFESRLLDTLERRGVLTAAELADLRAEAARGSDAVQLEARIGELVATMQDAPSVNLNHKGRFQFATSDGKYGMKVGGMIQARGTGAFNEDAADTLGFATARVRITLEGHVFSPAWKYRVQPELAGPVVTTPGGTSTAAFASLTDAWLEWTGSPAFGIRMGQWEVWYSRHQLIGAAQQGFVDRWSQVKNFAPAYQTGVMMFGGIAGEKNDLVSWSANILNGKGANVTNPDDTLMGLARIAVSPLGAVPKYDSDLKQGDFRVEAGLNAWTMGHATLADDYECIGADLTAMWHGFAFTSEWHTRSNPTGTPRQHGGFAQLIWNALPGEMDLGLRHGRFANEGALSGAADVVETTAVLCWYVGGPELKLQLDAGKITTTSLAGTEAGQWLVRLQAQVVF